MEQVNNMWKFPGFFGVEICSSLHDYYSLDIV